MAKKTPLMFTVDGTEYTLRITRRGLRAAEKQGFSLNEVESQIVSSLYMLVYAALYEDYKVSVNTAEEILDQILDEKQTTVTKLYEDLAKQLQAVFE